MKSKKLLVLVVLLSLWGGTMMFADAAHSKIKVVLNGSALSEALYNWDENNKQVTITKPNVHMFTFKDASKDSLVIFQDVAKGTKESFWVWAQVDSLQREISAVKIALVNPSGKEHLIQSIKVTEHKEDFQIRTEEVKYAFDAPGKYRLGFYMKLGDDSNWVLVSEKIINAK